MSGIAGIFHRDGRPADPEVLDRMAAAVAHRGPDGLSPWIEGPVGLVHSSLRSTPEAVAERWPHRDAAAGLVLVADGRVDNREELRTALVAAGEPPREDTDAELLLRAFAAWGEDAPARVVGDFAAALWDGRRRRLLLVRDAMGMRPLFWSDDGRTLLFASEPGPILDARTAPPRPNEGVVAEMLLQNLVTGDETLFEGILRVRPSEAVAADEKGVRRRVVWEPEAVAPVARSDEEHAERFHELLREAVLCRLRSPTEVALEVSGGLDSSSVAVVARELQRKGTIPCPGLRAYSLEYPGLDCDETPYFRAVADATGIPWRVVTAGDPGAEKSLAAVRLHRLPPEGPPSAGCVPMAEAVRSDGLRVRLSGEGGDERLGGAPEVYADLLRGGRILELFRRASAWSEPGSRFAPLAVVGTYAVRPLLPPWMRRAIRSLRPPTPLPPWFSPEFARRTAVLDRIREDPSRGRWATFEQAALWRATRTGGTLDALEEAERQAARCGQAVRSPFLDRRLVEFALSLPHRQRVEDGVSKAVLRRALKGLLPEAVRLRKDKAEFSAMTWRALRGLGGPETFERLALADSGWVRGSELGTLVRAMPPAYRPGYGAGRRLAVTLWTIFAVDVWYRTVIDRKK